MVEEKPQISEEIRLIPWWAILLAVVFFVGIQFLLHLVIFPREPRPTPEPLRYVAGFLAGTALAFFTLLVGYVNRDARRRGMSVALWTLIVIFVPNAIGFIIYFLLRWPLLINCPQCGATLNPSFNYCPKCKFNLHPTCPECKHAVQIGDAFCPYCARGLKGATTQ
jgi:hypothetical protein